MRLDKFLAQSAEMTRRQAQHIVRAGDVCVNGVAVKQAAQIVSKFDVVMCCR